MFKSSYNVLVTASGLNPVGHDTIQSLAGNVNKLVGVDINTSHTASYFCDKFYKVPVANSKSYINRIIDICKKESIDSIFPLTIEETLPLIKKRVFLKRMGITVVNINPIRTIDICNDKLLTYNFLKNHNLNVPAAYAPTTIAELVRYANKLNYPQRRIVLKPRVGRGGRGFRIITNRINQYEMLISRKISENFYLSLDDLKTIMQPQKKLDNILLTDYLEGDDYSVFCLSKKGESLLIIPAARGGLLDRTLISAQLVGKQSIINYVKQIIKAFNFSGFINIQLIDTKRGPIIYEINPRISATTAAALGTGINFPLLSLLMSKSQYEKILEILNKTKIHWGMKMYRTQRKIFKDGTKFFELS